MAGNSGSDTSKAGNTRQTFRGITRAIFARLRKRASRVGIHVASAQGEAEKDGVIIRWAYDASAQLLEVECQAPFWINANRVNADLRHEIEETIRAAA